MNLYLIWMRSYVLSSESRLSDYTRNLNNTMIYVTHDQIEAMTLADRIAIMRDGLIQQFDTPKKIYNNPVNKYVAGFIGSPSMNFLKGTILQNGQTHI